MVFSVPEQLKVIGYDGTYFIENFYPHLTTIKQPLEEIARLTVDLLLQKLRGKKLLRLVISYQLVSCLVEASKHIKNSDLISLSFSYERKASKILCAFSRLKVFSAIKFSTNLDTSASVAPAKSANDFA